MRAMQVSGPDYENLKLVEQPVPEPGPGEVQVRIRAATLNYRDFLLLQKGNPGGKMPYIPLSCNCGEVTAVGSGVTRARAGDRGAAAAALFRALSPGWEAALDLRSDEQASDGKG